MPHTTKETKQATPRERGDASLAFCNCSPLAKAEELLRYSETPMERPSATRLEIPMTHSVSMVISPACVPATMANEVITPSTPPSREARSSDMLFDVML